MKNNIIIVLLIALVLMQGFIAYTNYNNRDIGRYQMGSTTAIIDTKYGVVKDYTQSFIRGYSFKPAIVFFQKPNPIEWEQLKNAGFTDDEIFAFIAGTSKPEKVK